jgi:hypothetical protein
VVVQAQVLMAAGHCGVPGRCSAGALGHKDLGMLAAAEALERAFEYSDVSWVARLSSLEMNQLEGQQAENTAASLDAVAVQAHT